MGALTVDMMEHRQTFLESVMDPTIDFASYLKRKPHLVHTIHISYLTYKNPTDMYTKWSNYR